MAYLNDILGLLNLRENFGLGRDQLKQRAREFELEYGLTKEQADRAAQQWQQQFQEQQTRRQFEQQQQQEQQQRQQTQQNYTNFNRDHDAALAYFQNRNNSPSLLKLLSPGLIGSDQADALFKRFGLPTINRGS